MECLQAAASDSGFFGGFLSVGGVLGLGFALTSWLAFALTSWLAFALTCWLAFALTFWLAFSVLFSVLAVLLPVVFVVGGRVFVVGGRVFVVGGSVVLAFSAATFLGKVSFISLGFVGFLIFVVVVLASLLAFAFSVLGWSVLSSVLAVLLPVFFFGVIVVGVRVFRVRVRVFRVRVSALASLLAASASVLAALASVLLLVTSFFVISFVVTLLGKVTFGWLLTLWCVALLIVEETVLVSHDAGHDE